MPSKKSVVTVARPELFSDSAPHKELVEHFAKCSQFMCSKCNANLEFITAVVGKLWAGFTHKTYEDFINNRVLTVGYDIIRYKDAHLCWDCFKLLDGVRLNPGENSNNNSPLLFKPSTVLPKTQDQGRNVAKTSIPVREKHTSDDSITMDELMKYPRSEWEFILKKSKVYPTNLRKGDAQPKVVGKEVVRELPSHSKQAKKIKDTFIELSKL